MPQPSCTLQAGVMVNCFLLMMSALRGVPPVSLQPGIHSYAGAHQQMMAAYPSAPPSRSAAKLGPELTLRPTFLCVAPAACAKHSA